MANLIVDNDHNEAQRELKGEECRLRRELKAEDQRIRRRRWHLRKEKFEFETMELALKALPQLLGAGRAEEESRIQAATRKMRGVTGRGGRCSARDWKSTRRAQRKRRQ